jgi:hypothetical protein
MLQGKTRRQVIPLLLCIFAPNLWAQTPSSATGHTMPTPNMIDGSTNPAAISDKAAHRLFYLAVGLSGNASSDDQGRQDAHLKKIGLGSNDRKAVASALADFKNKYESFMNAWNATAEAALAKNQQFDPTPFVNQRDALVQSTRNTLTSTLTPEGLTLLLQHISAEKSKMRVDAQEAQ